VLIPYQRPNTGRGQRSDKKARFHTFIITLS
jgi:hypothetical protein